MPIMDGLRHKDKGRIGPSASALQHGIEVFTYEGPAWKKRPHDPLAFFMMDSIG